MSYFDNLFEVCTEIKNFIHSSMQNITFWCEFISNLKSNDLNNTLFLLIALLIFVHTCSNVGILITYKH